MASTAGSSDTRYNSTWLRLNLRRASVSGSKSRSAYGVTSTVIARARDRSWDHAAFYGRHPITSQGCRSAHQPVAERDGMNAAIFHLNHPANTAHWHFFFKAGANLVVIMVMLLVFVAAILLPFPHHGRRTDGR